MTNTEKHSAHGPSYFGNTSFMTIQISNQQIRKVLLEGTLAVRRIYTIFLVFFLNYSFARMYGRFYFNFIQSISFVDQTVWLREKNKNKLFYNIYTINIYACIIWNMIDTKKVNERVAITRFTHQWNIFISLFVVCCLLYADKWQHNVCHTLLLCIRPPNTNTFKPCHLSSR